MKRPLTPAQLDRLIDRFEEQERKKASAKFPPKLARVNKEDIQEDLIGISRDKETPASLMQSAYELGVRNENERLPIPEVQRLKGIPLVRRSLESLRVKVLKDWRVDFVEAPLRYLWAAYETGERDERARQKVGRPSEPLAADPTRLEELVRSRVAGEGLRSETSAAYDLGIQHEEARLSRGEIPKFKVGSRTPRHIRQGYELGQAEARRRASKG